MMIVAKTKMKNLPEICTECDFHKMLGPSWVFCEIKNAVTPFGKIVSDDFCPLIKINSKKFDN